MGRLHLVLAAALLAAPTAVLAERSDLAQHGQWTVQQWVDEFTDEVRLFLQAAHWDRGRLWTVTVGCKSEGQGPFAAHGRKRCDGGIPCGFSPDCFPTLGC